MLYAICNRCGRDIGPLDTSRQRFPDGLPEQHHPSCCTLRYGDIHLTEYSLCPLPANPDCVYPPLANQGIITNLEVTGMIDRVRHQSFLNGVMPSLDLLQ